MKKILYILLIFSFILSLFSCTTPPNTTPTSEETEETFEPESTDESPFDFILCYYGTSYYRVYPDEGIMLPLCPDPLCKHKDISCPFTKVSQLKIKGDLLYYTRFNADARSVYKVCFYNMSTDEYKLLYEVDKYENITYLHASEKYLYFNVTSGRQSLNTTIKLMRYDLSTGKAETVEEKLPDYTKVLTEENGRIYWMSGRDYFSTDLGYKNRIEDDRGYNNGYCTGGYALEVLPTREIIGSSGAKFPEKNVTRIDLRIGERSVLIESTGTYPMAYNGKVIYTRDEEAIFIGKVYDSYSNAEIKIYDKYGGKLYICNIDGSEDRLLCDFSKHGFVLDSSGVASIHFGKGDYIVYKVLYYEPVKGNPEYIQRGDDRLLVINIVIGEYKILSAE